MSGYSQLVFGFIGALGLIYLGYAIVDWWLKGKRSKTFPEVAQELGLQYIPRDSSRRNSYRFLDEIPGADRDQRYARNILGGTYRGYRVQVFNYLAEGEDISLFLLEQDVCFPKLGIYPEDFGRKLEKTFGLGDIDFESVEFSEAFVVRSSDREFAYNVCHPRMMEYLLEHRDLSLEVEGRCIAMSLPHALDPDEIPERLNQLVEIRRLFPEYLYRE